jgi:hypothetical protein
MSATMPLPAPSWVSAHRLILSLLALAMALVIAATVGFVLTQMVDSGTVAPSKSVVPGTSDVPGGSFSPAPGERGAQWGNCRGHACAR